MKYLIMCEGPNELEIIRMLLEYDKLIFTEDDLLNLVPYHARQIGKSSAVKAALNLYHGDVHVLRIGDKLSDQLTIPKEYKGQIKDAKKYCTKPELEMLLIISEGLDADFEKEKSKKSPKIFSKEHIVYNRTRYDNSFCDCAGRLVICGTPDHLQRHEKGGEVHGVPLPFVLKREILYLRMAHDILDSSCLHIFTVSLGV